MLRRFLLIALLWGGTVSAQNMDAPIQQVLQEQGEIIQKSSRRTIGPAIEALASSGLSDAQNVLERWQAREMWFNKETGAFVFAEEGEDRTLLLTDVAGGDLGTAPKGDYKQLKPNSGIRGLIGAALVQFQLSDPDPTVRATALDAIEREAEPSHLTALRAAGTDDDSDIQARKARLEQLLTIRFDENDTARVEAIEGFAGDLGVDVRAALNPLVDTEVSFSTDAGSASDVLVVGADISRADAYALLVAADVAPAAVEPAEIRDALIAHIDAGTVQGIEVASLDTDEARASTYALLAEAGLARPLVTAAEVDAILDDYAFFKTFTGAPLDVALAAQE
ncbi:MAG: urea ABC transporter permease subunit UrtB, partial [Pseudomonadota bacterium]